MISEKCFGKMKINAKKIIMKMCNFFNIASMGLKITRGWGGGRGCADRCSAIPLICQNIKEIKEVISKPRNNLKTF